MEYASRDEWLELLINSSLRSHFETYRTALGRITVRRRDTVRTSVTNDPLELQNVAIKIRESSEDGLYKVKLMLVEYAPAVVESDSE